ncbi:hypothetical protein GBF35_25700 [Nonomuraea phyllanthi]|uniref:hypothetical protein n=1 Tax=Nonomuraea phyllanthi TaxID=2219224 RepID=UPI001292F23A|nr:hypothetical protein [Nonomuraea phyllanthi]QFY09595.1 hypothetical protein GBF35_25700 [Nonomuraea phyllanthi]
MTSDASNSASVNERPTLPFDRKYAVVAMHAAWHMTCPPFDALRKLLVDLLRADGYVPADADLHADNLINIAHGVIDSIDAGEPRKVPWPGGQHAKPYVKAMYEMETSK